MKVEEYMESFSFDLAEKFCTRALELSPDNLDALGMAASVYLEIGKNEEAAKVCFCAVFCQHRFIVLYFCQHRLDQNRVYTIQSSFINFFIRAQHV